jgi:hypothetical protein
VLMTAVSNGTLSARLEQTLGWIHGWAPFSYIIILIIIAAPFVSIKIMNSWPKRVEPEDPMAKYRKEAAQGLVGEMED